MWATPEEAAYAYDVAIGLDGLEPINKVMLDPGVAAGIAERVMQKIGAGG